MVRIALSIAALCVVGSSSLRSGVFSHRRRGFVPKGSEGVVDGLFTFGAPGTGNPGFKNPRSQSGCFPGTRLWTRSKEWWQWQYKNDIVVPLAQPFGFEHPWLDGDGLDITSNTRESFSCSEELTRFPFEGDVGISMHFKEPYMEVIAKSDPEYLGLANVAVNYSYAQPGDAYEVAEGVKKFGWRLVDTAYDSGSFFGGPQVSHLVQNPETLECVLTFQGTAEFKHWFTNVNLGQVEFCGLNEKVHNGFRDHLRRIIRSDDFQKRLRPHFPKCSKFYVTGHSLGGGMSDLFTACVMNAPREGAGFHEDYKYVSWAKDRPARLPYK